jgi:hypothetical protein
MRAVKTQRALADAWAAAIDPAQQTIHSIDAGQIGFPATRYFVC